MRFLTGWIVAVALMIAGPVMAQTRPVVVELFTSQGCSSCPPADKFLHELAAREDVIALALHVDYWDYIGWKDIFADPRNTKRQKAYAKAGGRRSIYTPQMVIDGVDDVVGTHPKDVASHLRMHTKRAQTVDLRAARQGDTVTINAAARGSLGPMQVHLVRYIPRQEVKIKRGENAGKTLSYAHIVSDWTVLGDWDGRAPLSLKAKVRGNEPVVILIQRKGPGRIEAAAQLR